MNEIGSFEQWLEIASNELQFVLFVKTNNCSVCEGLYPQVDALRSEYPFPFYKADISKVPEMAGQLSLFTAPVVLLIHQGKELTRFARFVQMDELKYRLDELVERGKNNA